MTIGKLVRTRRRELGLSQAELALQLGLDQTYISKVESGRMSFSPRYTKLLADALKVELAKVRSKLGYAEDEVSIEIESRPQKPVSRRTSENRRTVPIVGSIVQDGARLDLDSDGAPVVKDETEFVDVGDIPRAAFALRLAGDFMRPIFRDGERLVVSARPCIPDATAFIRLRDGRCFLGILSAFSCSAVTLSLPDSRTREFPHAEVVFVGRVASLL